MTSSDSSILLPVDGSENSDRAVEFLIEWYDKFAPMKVRLLHVMTPPVMAANLPSRREAAEWDSPERRNEMVRSAESLLDAAGITYATEIRSGEVAQEIVRYAKEKKCSAIIMGTRGMGTTDEIFGSVVRQVVALTSLPVTLVK